MKKTISVILCLVMMISCFGYFLLVSRAADATQYLKAAATQCDNDQFTVNVKVAKGESISGAVVFFEYDPAVVAPVTGGIASAASGAEETHGAKLNSSNSFYSVAFVGKSVAGGTTADTDVLYATFKVVSANRPKTTTIKVSCDQILLDGNKLVKNTDGTAMSVATIDVPVIPTVTTLRVIHNENAGFDVVWDSVAGTDNYSVYRCEIDSNGNALTDYVKIAEVGSDITSYLDCDITLGKRYSYYVLCVINGTEGEIGLVVCAGDLVFTLNDDGESYSVCSCNSSASGELIIPAKYNGKSVTGICEYAFSECSELTLIEIPDSVISIGDYAFAECSSLNSITISDSVASVGDNAFCGCSCLENIYCSCAWSLLSEYEEDYNTIYSHNYGDWMFDTATCTENGLKYRVCSICRGAEEISIPATGHDFVFVEKNENHPHKELYKCTRCTAIKTIDSSYSETCPECYFTYTSIDVESIKIIGYNGAQSVLTIPAKLGGKKVVSTATGALKANTTLTEVIIENGVTEIASLTFLNCASLEKVIVPASVNAIGDYAFYGCNESFVIYCMPNSFAHQYALDNDISFVLTGITETENSVIDYTHKLIFTQYNMATDISSLICAAENVIAIPQASVIFGKHEMFGTGSTVTVFENNKLVGEYTVIVDGDIDGDSVCDVLDIALAERAVNGHSTLSIMQAYAANNSVNAEINAQSYQNVVNRALGS